MFDIHFGYFRGKCKKDEFTQDVIKSLHYFKTLIHLTAVERALERLFNELI